MSKKKYLTKEEQLEAQRKWSREYYHKNKEKARAYYEKNKEKIAAYHKEHRLANPEYYRQKSMEWKLNNFERYNEYQREWAKTRVYTPEQMAAKMAKYKEDYPIKHKPYHSERYFTRKEIPEQYEKIREIGYEAETKYSNSAKGQLRSFRTYAKKTDVKMLLTLPFMEALLEKGCEKCGNKECKGYRTDNQKDYTNDNMIARCKRHKPKIRNNRYRS